jgi:hypothetical protein
MMPSDVELFGSVDTSVFHGFGASNRRPIAVEVVVLDVDTTVLELDDDVVEVVVLVVGGRDVVDVMVVVAIVVVTVVVGGRDVDVVVIDVVLDVVAVVVVVDEPEPHAHATHVPLLQSGVVSHCSPAAGSTVPSPQTDNGASTFVRRVPRPVNVPVSDSQVVSSTFTVSRTLRSGPHVVQRARMVRIVPRRLVRGSTSAQPLSMLTRPASSTMTASNGSATPGTSGCSTRNRLPGHAGGSTAAPAGAAAATNAMASHMATVEVSAPPGRRVPPLRAHHHVPPAKSAMRWNPCK